MTGPRSQASPFNMIHGISELIHNSVRNYVYYSDACAIPDGDSVIITGGNGGISTQNTVSVYNIEGWQQDLPPLNTGRYDHACSSYMSDERRVRVRSYEDINEE